MPKRFNTDELIVKNYVTQLLRYKIDSSKLESASTWKKLKNCFNNSEKTEEIWIAITNKKYNLNYIKNFMIDTLKTSAINIQGDGHTDDMDIIQNNINDDTNDDMYYNNNNNEYIDHDIINVINDINDDSDDDINNTKRELEYEEPNIMTPDSSPLKKVNALEKVTTPTKDASRFFDSDFLPEYQSSLQSLLQTIHETPITIHEQPIKKQIINKQSINKQIINEDVCLQILSSFVTTNSESSSSSYNKKK